MWMAVQDLLLSCCATWAKKGHGLPAKLAKQKIANIPASSRVVLDQVVGGQFPLALVAFNHHVAVSAGKGAPVKFINMEPLLGIAHVVNLVRKAPHPNAAKLLIDFIWRRMAARQCCGRQGIFRRIRVCSRRSPNSIQRRPVSKVRIDSHKGLRRRHAGLYPDLQRIVQVTAVRHGVLLIPTG